MVRPKPKFEARVETSIGIEEPPLFSEPGVFLIRPDRALYYASVQTMPFVRPHFSEMVQALDFVIAKDYPARGEYAGKVRPSSKSRRAGSTAGSRRSAREDDAGLISP